MRAYRFVNELGRAIEAAGQAVADAADVTADHQGGLIQGEGGVESRVGGELLRQMARETDGRELERAVFEARDVRIDTQADSRAGPGIDIGLIVTIDLPTYRSTNVLLATVVHRSSLPTDVSTTEGRPIRSQIESLLEQTPAAFLFLVDDVSTRAIAGRSLLGMTQPVTNSALEAHLYGRSLGLFIEEFVEGFVGVARLEEDSEPLEAGPSDPDRLRAWGRDHALQGVYSLVVRTTENRTESSLSAFTD